MNFLALVKRLARECGVGGTIVTTVSQTGEALRLVEWLNEAWNEVQLKHQDWDWMRASTSFVTVAGQSSYTPVQCGLAAGTLGQWDRTTFRNYLTSAGTPAEQFMGYIEYDNWRDMYLFGSQRDVRTQPHDFTITPTESIGLGPVPPAGYTVSGDYFKAPSYMTSDTESPALPAQYHMLLVYAAMMAYGGYEAASEVYQRGEKKYNAMMLELEPDQLPELTTGGSLE